MSRWLITGASGQLGSDLRAALASTGRQDHVDALDRSALNIADAVAVRTAVGDLRPDVVINAAAYTAVDAAEEDEQGAYAVNAQGPAWLAVATAAAKARLIHVSTDYVFPGVASQPYLEDSATGPASAYGRTKLAGEQAVLALNPSAHIVRTAWVYGETGGNFVKTMLRLASQQDTVSVVDDQLGSPTWSQDLALGLVALGRSSAAPGIYHCTNSGSTSWFGLAQAVFQESGLDPARVVPTTTAAFPRPAPRPAYSVLDTAKWAAAGLPALPPWREALVRALPAITSASSLSPSSPARPTDA
jgi:dTDP-4-dehydrorhamnose reductase